MRETGPAARTVLVLGGARSGKSAYAEQRAAQTGRPVRYVATAVAPPAVSATGARTEAHAIPEDAEFAERIAIHRARRPAQWRTVEPGADLAGALSDAGDDCVIVDCLTLWLTGLFYPRGGRGPVSDWERHIGAFDAALEAARAPVYIVSNEIGLGVVPMGAETRRFVDELGRLNQRIAARCDEVVLMVAGLPMRVKP